MWLTQADTTGASSKRGEGVCPVPLHIVGTHGSCVRMLYLIIKMLADARAVRPYFLEAFL